MFDILFGWRKASKCKQLIKQAQCRLKLLKNKRATIVRQLRKDAAELIKNGYEDKAFNRVEEIIKDECIVTLYEMLENFCEFILLHLSYIRKRKDCPNDINEAVSSLIYASARCGDLPELRTIRKLFGERYGQKFAMTALELRPGNLVNYQVIEKLTLKPASDDMKHRLVNEIERNHCIKPEVLAIEYYSHWQQKVKEASGNLALDSNVRTYYEKCDMQICTVVEEFQTEDVHDSKIHSTTKSVPRLAPTISDSPLHDEEQELYAELDSPKGGEVVVHNDEIEELHCRARNGDELIYFQDKRAFKFKASVTKMDDIENHNYLETWSLDSWSGLCRRNLKGNEKRPRKRSVSHGNQFLKDGEYLSYYAKKHHKKRNLEIFRTGPDVEVPILKNNREISTTLPSHTSSSSSTSSPNVTSSYFRNVTMPPERVKEGRKEEFQRSVSDCFQYPTHVHPNLPDYEDIAATFLALKRERLQHHRNNQQ